MAGEILTSSDGEHFGYVRFGAGPLVVCHPGGPGAIPDYLENLGGLDATRTLAVLHTRHNLQWRPGFTPDYGVEEFVRDIEAFRIHHGLEKLDLIGHSHGASVVAMYAAMYPERVGHLVLVSLPHAGRLPHGLTAEQIDRQLAAITAPTLVISGRHDAVVPDGGMRTVAHLRRGRAVLFEECGHNPWQEYPPAFRDVVEAHLAGRRLPLWPGVQMLPSPERTPPQRPGGPDQGLAA